jgi:8-oxo-dGTP pyrophosphatase MutT (NUDIX family)
MEYVMPSIPPQKEASLEELLSDPIVWTLMKSDHIDEQELRDLLKRVAGDLAQAAAAEPSEMNTDINSRYRRGVGIMLLNDRHQVFVGRRIDKGNAWQMPQGGINEGENPRAAALRELKEEIGTDNARIVAESKGWLRYELPPELVGTAWGGRWLGQRQKWFVMRFMGEDSDINVATKDAEFTDWQWLPVQELPNVIVSFKRQLYVEILEEFTGSGTISKTKT